jgi:FkbH-like protein
MTFRLEELPWLETPPADFRSLCNALDASDEPTGAEIAALAGKRLGTDQLTRLSKSIDRARAKKDKLAPLAGFHLALLGNGTTCLFAPTMAAAAARHGVLLQLTQADYDQVVQEALDPSSQINSCKPDAVLLALDFHGLPFTHGNGSGTANQSALEYVAMIREGLEKGAGAPVIFQTVSCPPQPLFGELDSLVPTSLRRQIQDFNAGLRELAAKRGDYIVDVAALAEAIGSQNWHDPVQWNLYKLPFAQTMVPIYVDHVARLVGAIRGNARKCLVLDLDNTVWGGVIGDDGLEGIVIGQGDGVGEAYTEVQQAALALRERGIILAVCSKNTDEVARQPFREHPEMLLKLDHIAVFQANWSDKATNIEAIAKTLNIGLDSLVLLDDNPIERSQVRKALPMVAVPELPADPSLYARTLLNAGYFEAVTFSEEDRQRAALYQANAQRAELSSKSRDMGEFLASLEMKIEFAPFDAIGIGRITQLINKTNQFNLTTRRYTRSEVENMSTSSDFVTFQIRLLDRFGDNGIISIVIARHKDASYEIDTWLMSCRVLGRRVEEAVIAELVRHSRANGVKILEGKYIPTAKNALVRDHYHKLGFARAGGADDNQIWRLDISGYEEPSLPFEFLRDKRD